MPQGLGGRIKSASFRKGKLLINGLIPSFRRKKKSLKTLRSKYTNTRRRSTL